MTIPGLSGTLLSHEAVQQASRPGGFLHGVQAYSSWARARNWHVAVRERLGPAAGARAVFDGIAAPLFRLLGYRVVPSGGTSALLKAGLEFRGEIACGLVVTGWGRDAATAWRDAVRQGIGLDTPWCFCLTGPALRIVDARRTYSRRFVEFTLEATLDDEHGFSLFWNLLRADGMLASGAEGSTLDRAVALSESHRSEVRNALQGGVEEALVHFLTAFGTAAHRGARSSVPPVSCQSAAFGEALIVVHRVLFLLFAEARALVPLWHPVFRDGYTIEALRDTVEVSARPTGLWETLQAMSRLAHTGCQVGALKVQPFNGRLFSPGLSPLAECLSLDDGIVRQALLALTTRPARSGRVRVGYGDLGVEQLGAIYERLLDLAPAAGSSGPRLQRAETRRTTGSFYTPRSLTEFIVRRTLAPLVRQASADEILTLRVLDPAMGSGAFLVAACRYLAAAYEAALVREGSFTTSDISESDRVGFRRAVAQRCLYGVDLNPMAVQLGRLSLWLATLAADRPLTFLDHRLRVGNSLVGAGLDDLARQPPGAGRARRHAALPLFDGPSAAGPLGDAVDVRTSLALGPDDTLEHVRSKEETLADLERDGSGLSRWKTVADLWCSGWFRGDVNGRRTAGLFGDLAAALLGGGGALPGGTVAALLDETRAVSAALRFFRWTLESPEVFYDTHGRPLHQPGFDAILGNPPWEMLRGDRGTAAARTVRRRDATRLTAFTRTSGIYRFQSAGHANLYQLFLERSLALLRSGGRLGMLLPSGLATDAGSAALRRALFERTAMDGVLSIENRGGIFPIHRSLKFLVVTATPGSATSELTCRFGVRDPSLLDQLPDEGHGRDRVVLPKALIERLSGPSLAVPELRSAADVDIVSRLAFRWPALEDLDGWRVRFGRELNATEDRHHFVRSAASPARALPVVEGKHVSPFTVGLADCSWRIDTARASRLLGGHRPFDRPRLAYRDVASPTNRVSLIAAVVPAGAVTTHTLFCLKDPLDDERQHCLCGIFNSLVANYLIRSRISTHVGAAVIARLPVPPPDRLGGALSDLAQLAAGLARAYSTPREARLQALAARVYGVTRDEFQHILETFPLVTPALRDAAMRAFCDIVS